MNQVKEEVKTLGGTLKSKREELQLSIKEAENATSIRSNYLQAIEQGNMQKLISPVYAQGFVRQYATFLGMDADALIKQYPDLFGKPVNQEFSYGIGTLEARGNPGARIKAVPNVLWIAGFVAVLLIAWYFARYLEVL